LQILVAASVGGAVLHTMLLSRLRTRHPQTWRALGRPTIFVGRVAVMRFLLKGEYVTLGDVQLTRLARFLRRYLALYAVFLLVIVVAWIVSL
jgi:hypothetical protein